MKQIKEDVWINFAASMVVVFIWAAVAWVTSKLPLGLKAEHVFMFLVAYTVASILLDKPDIGDDA